MAADLVVMTTYATNGEGLAAGAFFGKRGATVEAFAGRPSHPSVKLQRAGGVAFGSISAQRSQIGQA